MDTKLEKLTGFLKPVKNEASGEMELVNIETGDVVTEIEGIKVSVGHVDKDGNYYIVASYNEDSRVTFNVTPMSFQ